MICDKCLQNDAAYIYGDQKYCALCLKDTMISQISFHRDVVRLELSQLQEQLAKVIEEYSDSILENFRLKVLVVENNTNTSVDAPMIQPLSRKEQDKILAESSDVNKKYFKKIFKQARKK